MFRDVWSDGRGGGGHTRDPNAMDLVKEVSDELRGTAGATPLRFSNLQWNSGREFVHAWNIVNTANAGKRQPDVVDLVDDEDDGDDVQVLDQPGPAKGTAGAPSPGQSNVPCEIDTDSEDYSPVPPGRSSSPPAPHPMTETVNERELCLFQIIHDLFRFKKKTLEALESERDRYRQLSFHARRLLSSLEKRSRFNLTDAEKEDLKKVEELISNAEDDAQDTQEE